MMNKRKSEGTRVVEFADFGGRKVEKVELFSSSEYQSITIRFDDNTDLSFVINAWFTCKPDFYDWKTGTQRVLKRWPVVKSAGV